MQFNRLNLRNYHFNKMDGIKLYPLSAFSDHLDNIRVQIQANAKPLILLQLFAGLNTELRSEGYLT